MSDLTGGDVITFIRENPEEVLRALTREHRTHQQSTVGSIYKILKGYAKAAETLGSDLRNEAAVAWATKIAKAEEEYFPFI